MSQSQTCAATLFIDLATFSELEGFLYGGPNAISWFVACIQKSNWFSFIPISLRNCSGIPDFGQRNVAASVNRSGDYVLGVWFRAQIPSIYLNTQNSTANLRWVHHLFHNIFERIQITFNELVVQEFDNYWLDNNYMFRVRGSKRMGYRNMIGDVDTLTAPHAPGVGNALPSAILTCPLPFFFDQDSGIALPVAALPFNDIKINYNFRRWQELVMIYPGNAGSAPATINDVAVVNSTSEPSLDHAQTYAHYAVVHNDERVKMGDAPRDMLIHQVQYVNYAPFKDVTTQTGFDLRLSHAIVSFFFAAENTSLLSFAKGSYGREFSNYTTLSAIHDNPSLPVGIDPIAHSKLLYENTVRFDNSSEYFSLIVPWYFSDAMPGVDGPTDTGYHMATYALKPWDPTRPSGSTNYSKLANVSIVHDMSTAAVNAANTTAPVATDGQAITLVPANATAPYASVAFPQTWRHIFDCRNWNIARVANGSLGHPTL